MVALWKMLLSNSCKYVNSSPNWHWQRAYQILLICLLVPLGIAELEEGDLCNIKALRGTCLPVSKCLTVETAIERRILTKHEVSHCGFTVREEMICCPILTGTPPTLPVNHISATLPESNAFQANDARFKSERASVRACREMEQRAGIRVVPHVLEGVAAGEGEYPHMVAIAHANPFKAYSFGCGGSLIATNFVLTAAHCIYKIELQPLFVRLGAVNVETPSSHSMDINVTDIYIHDNYSSLEAYNDIGIIKLAEHAPNTEFINPICLHTEADAEPKTPLYFVMGWGISNITNRNLPTILLKAAIEVVPLPSCNATFAQEYSYREGQLSRGIVQEQLCAQSRTLTDITCLGDSGGPLVLLSDAALQKLRIVGIISTGSNCGGSIPGIYTRVSAYLDFIERIVWPDG